MKIWGSLLAVVALLLAAWGGVGAAGMTGLFGSILPGLAFLFFLAGVVWRVVLWGRSPVPFRIPTTCGQEKTLPWIPAEPLENPPGAWGAVGRMALEVLLFRSLFRNARAEIRDGRPLYGSAKGLWLAGLAFHWSFLVIVLRHLRWFTEPVPAWVNGLAALDGFFEILVPTVYLTDAVLLAALTFLLLRRILDARVRYLSLAADYFPLFLLLGIALTGFLMRHVWKVDLMRVKALTTGWLSLQFPSPEGIGVLFYLHLFLVATLLAYFPLSKLVHMGGVFLSPTRNLANNNRAKRHANPWNAPVKVHTYEEYEDEFRDKMQAAGIPVEKEG